MYRTPSKQRQRIRLIATYSVMTIAVGLLVTFLVFIMLGYRFNRDTSSIQQGGLVQFASRPTDANVTIGNAKLTDLTPSKITVNPGNYDVTMNRSGYKQWQKNVDVQSGEVLWLNYAQMVPNTIETETVETLPAVSDVKSSPNGDRYAVLTEPTKPELTFIDVTGNEPKIDTVTIPSTVLPQDKTISFSLGKWASDSDRLLVTMKYDTTVEYLVVDRRDDQNDKTINISKAYQADIADILFDPRSSERLFVRSSTGEVRLIDVADDSLSSVLASNVTSVTTYENDALLLVQTGANASQTVGYLSLGSDTIRTIKQVDSAAPVKIDVARYFSQPYVAITSGSQLDVYKLRDLPSSESDDAVTMTSVFSSALPSQVEYLSIRSGGRFVVAQYATGVQTYDIELSKQTLTNFNTPVGQELRWLDRYHFYVTNGTELQVMEFDGANSHAITALRTQFDAVQSDNGTFIYSINATENGFALQRSRMILE